MAAPTSLVCIQWPNAANSPPAMSCQRTAMTMMPTIAAATPRTANWDDDDGLVGVALLIGLLFRRLAREPMRNRRTLGHDAGSARDRSGEVEVGYCGLE